MTFQIPKMKVTLNCGACKAPVIERIASGKSAGSPMSYSKNMIPKFAGQVFQENVKCPTCGALVIQLTGLGRGVHGSWSMSTVQTPKKEVEEKP